MFCIKCGNLVKDGEKFCGQCGAKLTGDETGASQESAAGQQAAGTAETEQHEVFDDTVKGEGKGSIIADFGMCLLYIVSTLIGMIGLLELISYCFDYEISSWIYWSFGGIIVVGKLVRTVLRNSEKLKISKAKGLFICGLIAAAAICIIIFWAVNENSGGNRSNSDKYVQMVKNATLEAYPQKTVGDAFDGYLKNPKWESGVSEDGTRCVNVTGKILYYEKETDITVQFIIENDKTGSFSYNACELNGVPQNDFFVLGLLEDIYNGDEPSSAGNPPVYVPGENSIMIGETRSISAYDGEMEVTLDSIEFTDGPLLTPAFMGYDYHTPDDGFTYLVATLTVKNIGTTNASLFTGSSTVIYDGKYEYKNEYWTMGESISELVPLSNAKTTEIIFMVPKVVTDSEDALVVNISGAGEHGSEDISYVIRSGNNDEFDAGVQTPSAEYVGTWQDTYSQRCYMEISSSDGIQYYIDINWGSSAQENTHWSLWGMYDEVMGGIYYNGSKIEEYYPEGGEMQETIVYSDGAGLIWMGDDGMLYWDDHVEEQGRDCSFEKSIY